MENVNSNFNRKFHRAIVLLIITATAGFFLIMQFTRFGLGTIGDSVHYIMGAQNLLDGKGYSRTSGGGEIRPITMAPPFYSMILSGLAMIDHDLNEAVRLFQALLFAMSIFLVGLIIFHLSRSIWLSLFGAVIMLTTSNLIMHYGWVLTEAVYIFLFLIVVYCLAVYFDTQRRYLILLSGFLIGLTTLTRYVGASLITAGLSGIFIFGRTKWKQRLIDCLVLFIAWVAPVSLWFVRNIVIGGSIANREVSYHPMAVELIRAYRAEISFWFVPAQLGFPHWLRKIIMTLLAIVGPVIFFFFELRDRLLKKIRREDPFWIMSWFLMLHMVFYAGFIFLTLTFTDAVTDFYVVPRYLIPVYVSALILYPIVFHRLIWQRCSWLMPRLVFVVIGLCLIFFYAQESIAMLIDPLPFISYTGFHVREAETTERINAIDGSVIVISNNPEMFYVISDRSAYTLPIQFDFVTGKERDDFEEQMEATIVKLSQGALIVVFTPLTEREKEVIHLLDVELLEGFPRSQFYGYPEATQGQNLW
jgi:4-amino-4-deoxy-L-arabinose transferase-like glycosyltransferase